MLNFPDGPEWLVVGVIVVAVAGAFATVPWLDAEVRYVATAPADYLSSPDANLTFTQEQIELLNEVSSRSLGFDAVAAERLYCGDVRDGRVRNLRLADRIDSSTLTSVSGECISRFGDVDLFIHTQPDGSSQLSEEDRDVESSIEYSCIQYAEIAVGPRGSVGGLNCWQVDGVGESADFTPVEVAVE